MTIPDVHKVALALLGNEKDNFVGTDTKFTLTERKLKPAGVVIEHFYSAIVEPQALTDCPNESST